MEIWTNASVRQNDFDLGAKEKRIRRRSVIQRLNAKPVTGNEQCSLLTVPNRECEHAAQVLNAIAAVLFVKMNDGFGIAIGAIAVAALLQFLAQFGVIVDFAVEDNPNCAVFVAERLVPAGDINDAQTAHADCGWPVGINAFIVW